MTEPQYDQTDADNFYLVEENRALRAKVNRLERRVDALESAMNPQDVADVDATLRAEEDKANG